MIDPLMGNFCLPCLQRSHSRCYFNLMLVLEKNIKAAVKQGRIFIRVLGICRNVCYYSVIDITLKASSGGAVPQNGQSLYTHNFMVYIVVNNDYIFQSRMGNIQKLTTLDGLCAVTIRTRSPYFLESTNKYASLSTAMYQIERKEAGQSTKATLPNAM